MRYLGVVLTNLLIFVSAIAVLVVTYRLFDKNWFACSLALSFGTTAVLLLGRPPPS